MKITRIQIHNFMGISAVAYDIPEDGGVIEGGNGGGKTSVIRAVRAALEGRGVDATAIRNGATEAEIIIDFDDVSVRRVIGEKNNSLTLLLDGQRQKAPKTKLQELIGLAPLDPLELFEERDPGRRKAMVLAALPARVTMGMLRRWLPDVSADDVKNAVGVLPNGGDADDIPGHGLDVLKQLREYFYGQRTEKNRVTKSRSVDVVECENELASARKNGEHLADVQPLPKDEAKAALTNIEGRFNELIRKRREAEESVIRNRRAVTRADELRAEAARIRDAAPLGVKEDEFDAAEGAVFDAKAAERTAFAEAERLRALLDRAISVHAGTVKTLDAANAELKRLQDRHDMAEVAVQKAASVEMQAGEIESLAGVVAGPSDQEIEDARLAANAAQKVVDRVAFDDATALANERLTAARRAQSTAEFESKKLDIMVRTLTEDAPAQLLGGLGLEGISVDGETILVNGVSLDRLCGSESLEFCVDIAKLLNRKLQLMLVDGLERLDVEHRKRFYQRATAGGYQLIGTLVSVGAAHLEPIGGVS